MRALGRSGVEVSPLGFGAAGIGSLSTPVDDETAHEAVRAAWQRGIRCSDTAPHHGLGLSGRAAPHRASPTGRRAVREPALGRAASERRCPPPRAARRCACAAPPPAGVGPSPPPAPPRVN
ncbi:aldo/keto reductase [Streptomyces collinus]|uniref:aldo/keto reductase n=1 Tax=Streptomyces collinus TaxID=42684 RepID=UPI0036EBDFFF